MDFGTIKKKLNHNIYQNVEDFLNDMALVFNNCTLYNGTESLVGKIGVEVRREYNRLLGMYNFVERFQNSSQVHPSVLFIQDLQQKKKEEESQATESNKGLPDNSNNLVTNQEENEFPIPKKIELEGDIVIEEEEQADNGQFQIEEEKEVVKEEEEKELSEDSLMDDQKNLLDAE